jgi:Flp pilus assembly pilin Flp
MRTLQRGSSHGQAMTEYLLVVGLCVLVLVLTALGPQPIVDLLNAIKKFFSAYSYAISITPFKKP